MEKIDIKKASRVYTFDIRSDADGREVKITFPFSIMSSLIHHKHVGLSSVFIEYVPYITSTNHGTYKIEICDERRLFENDSLRAQLVGTTDTKHQVEFTGFDWAAKSESSPYKLICRTSLESIALDKTIGKVKVMTRFTYSNREPPHCVPKVKGLRRVKKGKADQTLEISRYVEEKGNGVFVDFTDKDIII